MYAQDSIELLKQSGIDFAQNESRGIDVHKFGELLMSSGIVLNEDVSSAFCVGSHARSKPGRSTSAASWTLAVFHGVCGRHLLDGSLVSCADILRAFLTAQMRASAGAMDHLPQRLRLRVPAQGAHLPAAAAVGGRFLRVVEGERGAALPRTHMHVADVKCGNYMTS